MNLWKLSWRQLFSKPLATLLSALLLTLGTGIISFLILLNRGLEERLTRNSSGIDMVLGAKGSPLQLILSSIYHMDAPTGNIPLAAAEKLVHNPAVKWAIPLAYGDNYKGFRVVGTTTQYVAHYKAALSQGRLWQQSLEACIGSAVAERLGLRVGDTFLSTHGLAAEGGHEHEAAAFRVVGILRPSRTVLDQLVLTDVKSVWLLHEQERSPSHELALFAAAPAPEEPHSHSEPETAPTQPATTPAAKPEITAMLVKFRSPMAALQLPRLVNTTSNLQAAVPAIEVNRLFSLLVFGAELLQAIGLIIMTVAGISVFVSLYNSLKERRYELAIMRTLGASQLELLSMTLLEALQLSLVSFVAGLLLSRVGLLLLFRFASESLPGNLYHLQLQPAEIYLLLACLLTGFLAALLPALEALSTNISKTLSDAS